MTVLRDYHVPKNLFEEIVLNAAGMPNGSSDRREIISRLKVQIGKVAFIDTRVATQHIKNTFLRLLKQSKVKTFDGRYVMGDFSRACCIPIGKKILPDKCIVDVITKGVAGGGKEYIVKLPPFFEDRFKKGKTVYYLGQKGGRKYLPSQEDISFFDEIAYFTNDENGITYVFGISDSI